MLVGHELIVVGEIVGSTIAAHEEIVVEEVDLIIMVKVTEFTSGRGGG